MEMTPRLASDSRSSLAILTQPGHANPYGTVHGGVILRLADEVGALAAFRHSGAEVIATAAIDGFAFLGPVHVGERLELTAEVSYAGRTSVEVRIDVHAEPMARREPRRVGYGYGVYVALDRSGRPSAVPPLHCETEADTRRDEAARARRAIRLARRQEETGLDLSSQ